jgi:photosystem II PsbZ protein
MFIFTFQALLLTLILLSLILLIGVPVVFASPNGWSENKNYIIIGTTAWVIIILTIGILNYFVI